MSKCPSHELALTRQEVVRWLLGIPPEKSASPLTSAAHLAALAFRFEPLRDNSRVVASLDRKCLGQKAFREIRDVGPRHFR